MSVKKMYFTTTQAVDHESITWDEMGKLIEHFIISLFPLAAVEEDRSATSFYKNERVFRNKKLAAGALLTYVEKQGSFDAVCLAIKLSDNHLEPIYTIRSVDGSVDLWDVVKAMSQAIDVLTVKQEFPMIAFMYNKVKATFVEPITPTELDHGIVVRTLNDGDSLYIYNESTLRVFERTDVSHLPKNKAKREFITMMREVWVSLLQFLGFKKIVIL